MKNIEDILQRAVILLAFSDRCALEKEIINGVKRSTNEREMQRQAIINWLIRTGYYDQVSEKEKQVFITPVINKTNMEILAMQNDYECLEPMLWSLGLVSELSDYGKFVMDDFHPLLKFGRDHSMKKILGNCNMVSSSKMKEFRDRSMLWYWRCLECRNSFSNTMDIKKAVYNIFGESYTQLLIAHNIFDYEANDFVVNGKIITNLTKNEIEKLSIISERRFYSFEWLCTDQEWDNVDLVC